MSLKFLRFILPDACVLLFKKKMLPTVISLLIVYTYNIVFCNKHIFDTLVLLLG